MYESSKGHPRTNLILYPDEQIKFRIDITKLVWVHAADSRPPYADFFDFIEKSMYQLDCRLEFVPEGEVISNSVIIEVK